MDELGINAHDEVAHCQLRHLLRIHPFLEATSGVWPDIHRICSSRASPRFPYLTSNLVDCIELFKRHVSAEYNAVLHNSY